VAIYLPLGVLGNIRQEHQIRHKCQMNKAVKREMHKTRKVTTHDFAVINNVFQCKGYWWNLAKHGTTQSGTWQVEHCIQDLLLRVFVLHNRHLWNLDNSAGICTPTEQARTLYRRCHQIFWMQRMFDRLMGVALCWLLIICCPFVRPDERAHRDNSLDDRHESRCIKLFKLDMPLFCLGRKRRVLNVALLVAGVCGGTVCQMASRSKMPPHVWSLGTLHLTKTIV